MPAVATAQAERTIAPEDIDAYVAEFEQDPHVTPVVDGVGGISDAELAEYHELVRATQEAGNPETELVPGEMWSDTVGLPPSVDKADADAAEIAIATEQHALPSIDTLNTLDAQTMVPASAHCKTFLFSPHQVCGAILERYEALGGLLSWLMHPIEPMHLNPDGQGYRQRFQNGFIYWHPATGAHAVTVRNANVWERNGWEQGWLGYPLGGEVPVKGTTPTDGELHGWVQLFQGGRMYRTPLNQGPQVASINGLILDKWLDLGGPDSDLGFPIADEAKTTDGVGRFSVFQHGSIYWHPQHGAFEVGGLIEEVWAQNGYASGRFGMPISDSYTNENGDIAQDFQGGTVNLSQEIHTAGTSTYLGKEVSNLLISSLTRRLGVLPPSSSAADTNVSQLASQERPNNGGVSIPPYPQYIYNPDLGGLNDYCTWSPDIFKSALAEDADFAGACARHDICYRNLNNTGGTSAQYANCNRQFKDNLLTVCRNVYANHATVRQTCITTARTYYEAVVAKHPSHWSGHLAS